MCIIWVYVCVCNVLLLHARTVPIGIERLHEFIHAVWIYSVSSFASASQLYRAISPPVSNTIGFGVVRAWFGVSMHTHQPAYLCLTIYSPFRSALIKTESCIGSAAHSLFSNRLDKVNCKLISSFRSFQSNALLVAHSWKIWIGTVVIRGWGNALRLEKNVSRIRPWRREFERLLEYEWGILEMFSKLSDTNHTTLQWIVRFTAFESRMKCIRRLSTGHIINIVHSGVFFLFIARLHVYTSNRISVPFNRKSQALFQTATPMQRKNANGKSFGWCNVFFSLVRSFVSASLVWKSVDCHVNTHVISFGCI